MPVSKGTDTGIRIGFGIGLGIRIRFGIGISRDWRGARAVKVRPNTQMSRASPPTRMPMRMSLIERHCG